MRQQDAIEDSSESPAIEQVIVTPALLQKALPYTNFDTELSIMFDYEATRLLERDYWRVNHSFKYYIGEREDDRWVLVPAGYLTDGASVPRPFWVFIPPWGTYGQAAVVHDILCDTYQVYDRGVETKVNRAQVDSIFKEAMKVAGVPRLTYTIIYLALRVFSKFHYYRNKERRALKKELQDKWTEADIPIQEKELVI